MPGGTPLTKTEEIFASVAQQLMTGDQVTVDDRRFPVKRISSGHLRMVQFSARGKNYEAIEQNPEKSSRWAKLAREKHQVVQFIELDSHHYVAVSVDGKIRPYAHKGNDY